MILELLFGVLTGLVSHQTSNIIRKWAMRGTGEAWLNLARYTIGVVVTLPVYMLMRKSESELKKEAFAYIASFFSVGVGVAIGYVLDDLD